MKVYLGLGSNIGDRLQYLIQAIAKMNESEISVQRISSYWETEPVGYADQPWFLNAVVEATTVLKPALLLTKLKQIEFELGRKQTVRNGPREIDIDILLYGDAQLQSATLTVPHSRLHQRRFVLEPLVELAPEVQHPILGKSMRELLDALKAEEPAEAGSSMFRLN